jgi:hypothetical protein
MVEAGFAVALMFAAMTQSLEGTLMTVDTSRPVQLMVNIDRQFQTFAAAKGAVAERDSTLQGDTTPVRVRIEFGDLTPGEFVRLQLNSARRVTRARAIAVLERKRARSVDGATVVLEDGTTLTISSVLRYVDERGNESAIATVRPGDLVQVFRNPVTRNIYRFSAMPRSRLRKHTQRSKD